MGNIFPHLGGIVLQAKICVSTNMKHVSSTGKKIGFTGKNVGFY